MSWRYQLLVIAFALGVTHADGAETSNALPAYERLVMTWVPPYAIAQCKVRLQESYGGVGMKDALTHLGLQFWMPTEDGGLARAGKTNDASDAAIRELRDWGHTNGVRVLLCVYNHVGSWSWQLARAGFAEHPEKFANALLAEVNRLGLDGVDLDLEGSGRLDSDKETFVRFVRMLSKRLHAENRQLTVDSFAYIWSAPNQTWWKELLPHVDGLTTMGYDRIGSKASEWRSYEFQKTAAGQSAARLMIGLPSNRGEWRGSGLMEQLAWLQADGEVGVSFWDAQLRSDAWRKPEVWKMLREIRGGQR